MLSCGTIDFNANMSNQVIAAYVEITEVSHLKKIFVAMDSSGDGEVTVAEFADVLKAAGLPVPTDLEDLLKTMDSDGNGQIGYTEFIAAAMTKAEYVDEDLCWAAFRMFDRNGDGVISRTEVEEILTLGELEDEDERNMFVDRVMLDIDEDGSGTIDWHEFLEIMRSDEFAKATQNQKNVKKKLENNRKDQGFLGNVRDVGIQIENAVRDRVDKTKRNVVKAQDAIKDAGRSVKDTTKSTFQTLYALVHLLFQFGQIQNPSILRLTSQEGSATFRRT